MLHVEGLRLARLRLQPSWINSSSVSKISSLKPKQRTLTTYYPLGGQPAEMEKKTKEQTEKKGDVMADSFGEGYSTRSDEEGFGGVYDQDTEEPNDAYKKHHDYDISQGSEVTEKEKARNQKEHKA